MYTLKREHDIGLATHGENATPALLGRHWIGIRLGNESRGDRSKAGKELKTKDRPGNGEGGGGQRE